MNKKMSVEEVRELIAEKYSPKYILQQWSPSVSYIEYEEITSSDYKTKDQTVNLRIGIDKMGPIVVLVCSATFLFMFPFFNRGKETTDFLVLLYCISFGLIIFSLYRIFFTTKIIFTTNATSFTFKDQTILWDDIVTTGIEIVHGGPSHHYAILGLSSGEIIKLDIGKSDIGPTDLIRIIHLNRTAK